MLAIVLVAAPLMLMAYIYEMPMDALCYAAGLSLFLVAVIALIDGYHFLRTHRALQKAKDYIGLSVEEMPQPRDLVELDYQELLQEAHRAKLQAVAQQEQLHSDLIEYYTLWGHQIKTPIAALDLLLQTGGGSQSEACASELFKIEQYVQMLLSYLRLDSDSSDFVLRSCPLDGIVRQAIRKYAKLFIGKKITLDFQPSGAKVLTDEKWLCFAIEQILSNAIKYTPAGTISVYEQDGELIIADTGIGIAPEDLPRVFEKGYTGYNGRTNQKSTGIGLYLCKRILTKLGHSITITSQLGQGTQVHIDLTQTRTAVIE